VHAREEGAAAGCSRQVLDSYELADEPRVSRPVVLDYLS
jgi:hypothetical protein